jgi:hypothetical protein
MKKGKLAIIISLSIVVIAVVSFLLVRGVDVYKNYRSSNTVSGYETVDYAMSESIVDDGFIESKSVDYSEESTSNSDKLLINESRLFRRHF